MKKKSTLSNQDEEFAKRSGSSRPFQRGIVGYHEYSWIYYARKWFGGDQSICLPGKVEIQAF